MTRELGECAGHLSKMVRLSQTYFVDADALNQTASKLNEDAESLRKQAQRHEEQAAKCEHAALRLQKRGEADRAIIQNEFDKLLAVYAPTLDGFLETAENRKTFDDVQARVEEGRAWDHEVEALVEALDARLSTFEQRCRQDIAGSDGGLSQLDRGDKTVQTNGASVQTESPSHSFPHPSRLKQQDDVPSDHSEVFFEPHDQKDDPESGLHYEKYSKYVTLDERFRQSSAPSLTSALRASSASNRPRSDHFPNFLNTYDPSQPSALPARPKNVMLAASTDTMQSSLPSIEATATEAAPKNSINPNKNPSKRSRPNQRARMRTKKAIRESLARPQQSTANEGLSNRANKTTEAADEGFTRQQDRSTANEKKVSKNKKRQNNNAAGEVTEQQQITASTEDGSTDQLDRVSPAPEPTADSPSNDNSGPPVFRNAPQRKRKASESTEQPPAAKKPKKQQPEQIGMAETLLNMAKTLLDVKRQTIDTVGRDSNAKEHFSKKEDEVFQEARAWVDEQKERLGGEEVSKDDVREKDQDEAETGRPATRREQVEKALQMRMQVLKSRGELSEDADFDDLREYELAEHVAANHPLRC